MNYISDYFFSNIYFVRFENNIKTLKSGKYVSKTFDTLDDWLSVFLLSFLLSIRVKSLFIGNHYKTIINVYNNQKYIS